jgi:hypothetical protein
MNAELTHFIDDDGRVDDLGSRYRGGKHPHDRKQH